MEHQAIEKIAKQYREEGYDVTVNPRGDKVPPFLNDFQPDLIATRGNEGIIVAIKTNRVDLSTGPDVSTLAQTVNSQSGWRLDVVILEEETPLERAAQEAAEPSDEQLAHILKTADELTDKGDATYACIIAWAGLEAAMRRLRQDAESYGKNTPNVLMRTLYGNGFLSREQFDRLKQSFKIRNQVAHGLVPPPVDPDLVHYVTATARSLVHGGEAALQAH